MNMQIDIRSILATIRVPTLVMHRSGDQDVNVAEGRYIAERIPGARFVELAGDDHLPWLGEQGAFLDELQEFLTGVRPAPEYDRVLSTVMFTDIVGSTEVAASTGDSAFRDLLGRHREIARTEIARFHGRKINTSGDGFFATFDGPARGSWRGRSAQRTRATRYCDTRGRAHRGSRTRRRQCGRDCRPYPRASLPPRRAAKHRYRAR